MSNAEKGFYVAPFAPDGEALGVGFRTLSGLSSRWLSVAGEFLRANGPNFRASWGRELHEIETRLTSANGVGLCTFFARGRVVSSHLFLTGVIPEAEAELIEMFLESLRGVTMVQALALEDPFGSVRALKQRPLEVAVLWSPSVPEQLIEMTQELSLHFAGAFFADAVSSELKA